MGTNINKRIESHKIAISIFVVSLFATIGLGVVVLQGILQESWYMDLVICALGATAFTSLYEALGGKG